MKAPVEDTRSIYIQVEVDQIVSRVMAGKYSARTTSKDTKMSSMPKCPNCPAHYRAHELGRCSARGKTCVVCHSKNFARSCNGKKTESVKALEDADPPYQYDSDASVHRVEVIEISRVQTTNNNLVTVHIKNTPVQLFVDSGCCKTLIPHKLYQPQMGPIKPISTRFHPYGTHHHLSVLGQVSTTLVAESGAQHKTIVFIIEGHQIQPLLGDADTKSLGILCINPERKTKKGVRWSQ